MFIARKRQLYLVTFLLSSLFLALSTFLLLTGALGAGFGELHNVILASMYKFC